MEGLVKEISEEKEMDERDEITDQKDDAKTETSIKEIEEENNNEQKFEKTKAKHKKVKKALKDMTPSEYRRKKWLIPSIIVIVIVIAIFFSTIFALVNINNEKIINGVSIAGVDVSGLSKEEATTKMSNIYEEKKEKEINVKYEDYENSLNPTLMEVNYDVKKAVEEAFLIGKDNNIIINNYNILFTLIGKKNINVDMTLNEDTAKQSIEDIGINLPGIIIESSYAIEDDELIITKGKAGIVIDTEELLNKVKDNLNDINSKEDYIEIPVKQKEPEVIDIDKIHEEVYTEVQDAYYTKDPFTVYQEVEGIDFDVEAARELLKEDKEEYVIQLTITKPTVTIDQIGSEAFPDQLGTCTTRYDVSDVDRTTNLVIACQKINGKVLLPGETFSYNEALGPRTTAAGYKNGKVYEGGKVVDGIGGGICQISSTLYNSVLTSNLEIVERRNHQFVTSYLPAGRDATVVYGSIDFKFKNTRQYPVRIVASAKNGIATVSIYGIKEENEYTFSFSTKTISSIPYTTTYEEDSTLAAGTEKVKQKGTNGLITETYITKMLNGKVVSTTLLSRDTYNAMERIIIKGTKGGTTTTTTPSTTTTTTETNTQTTPSQSIQTPSTQEPSESTSSTTTPSEETTSTTTTTEKEQTQTEETNN
jgi:vancomycin resistance protein YoaR